MGTLITLLFTSLKMGKVLLTVGTMLLSIGVYTLVFGWRFAVGFVLLIFFHEMGHFLAARQRGLKVGAPTFIPFVGAWINMKEMPKSVETEAYVGVAGPIAGTVASLACYGLARYYESDIMLALAYSGCFINLFNLIPLSPLDGGRITAILSPRIWFVGAPILVLVYVYRPSPVIVMLGILALPQLIAAWKFDPASPENVRYYEVSREMRLIYGALYLALVTFLAVMTYDLHQSLVSQR